MKTGGFTFGQARLIALLLLAGLSSCANQVLGGKLDNHQNSIAVGKTTKTDIHNQLGAPDEEILEDGIDIWVYQGKTNVPTAISLIPIVGDIGSALETIQNMNNNNELIIQFDERGVVKKSKLRALN